MFQRSRGSDPRSRSPRGVEDVRLHHLDGTRPNLWAHLDETMPRSKRSPAFDWKVVRT